METTSATQTKATQKLTCQMSNDCASPVTHIDNHGFIYCTKCGESRKYSMPTRQMRVWEVRVLENGGCISYARRSKTQQGL